MLTQVSRLLHQVYISPSFSSTRSLFSSLVEIMARVSLAIQKLKDRGARQVTYSKRRSGLLKKASELSNLCGVDVALVMFSPTGRLTAFASNGSRVEEVFLRFLEQPPKIRGGQQKDEEHVISELLHLKAERELIEEIARREDALKEIHIVQQKILETKEKLRFYIPQTQFITTLHQANRQELLIMNALQRLEKLQESVSILPPIQKTWSTQIPWKQINDVDQISEECVNSNQYILRGKAIADHLNSTTNANYRSFPTLRGTYSSHVDLLQPPPLLEMGMLVHGMSNGVSYLYTNTSEAPSHHRMQGTLVQGMSNGCSYPYNNNPNEVSYAYKNTNEALSCHMMQGPLVQGMSNGCLSPYKNPNEGSYAYQNTNEALSHHLMQGTLVCGMSNGCSYPYKNPIEGSYAYQNRNEAPMQGTLVRGMSNGCSYPYKNPNEGSYAYQNTNEASMQGTFVQGMSNGCSYLYKNQNEGSYAYQNINEAPMQGTLVQGMSNGCSYLFKNPHEGSYPYMNPTEVPSHHPMQGIHGMSNGFSYPYENSNEGSYPYMNPTEVPSQNLMQGTHGMPNGFSYPYKNPIEVQSLSYEYNSSVHQPINALQGEQEKSNKNSVVPTNDYNSCASATDAFGLLQCEPAQNTTSDLGLLQSEPGWSTTSGAPSSSRAVLWKF